MPHSADCPKGRSQLFTFSRRELFPKIASTALLCFAPHRQSAIQLPAKYPAPSFGIGDRVASHWSVGSYEDNDRDWDSDAPPPEIGEIVGICWHPIHQHWKYQINWVSGSGDDWMSPCFDEYLCDGSGLGVLP
ncbi:MAG: hypothetical protein EAZ96_17180 [Oscillatoriales cyanobacterium]|nr:MAG: hypothetical protein EAZ96_17180 [Oscillatoriales cyanobacterium]